MSFVEGASRRSGGVGLIGVPPIAKSIADRGHQVALNIADPIIPSAIPYERVRSESIFPDDRSAPCLNVFTYASRGRWAFTPSLIPKVAAAVRSVDFVTLHSLYSFPVLAGYLLARAHRKPYGLWPHGVLAPFQRRVSARKKAVYDRVIARQILQNASVLFFSAIGERDETRELGLRTPSVIVPHGIDTAEYAELPPRGRFRDEYMDGHSGPLILYLGRLNAKKGLDLLIEAVSRAARQEPDIALAIAGGGDPPEYANYVRDLLIQHGLEKRAVMTGLLTNQQKIQAMADADIFALASHAENFCFAMFEAMASGVPVVISDSLNLAGEVAQCSAGLVVPRDAGAFASAILTLVRDQPLRQQMGRNGLALARRYSWESTGERVERTIECVLKGVPIPPDLTMIDSANE